MLRSYTPADLLTLANASCGTVTIFLCLGYIEDAKSATLWAAFVLLNHPRRTARAAATRRTA